MAKQTGVYKITGCVEGICFYQMDGQYFARKKSSLSRNRVLHDPAFLKTRLYASLLAKAAKIASVYYHTLPEAERNLQVYRRITDEVMRVLKATSNT